MPRTLRAGGARRCSREWGGKKKRLANRKRWFYVELATFFFWFSVLCFPLTHLAYMFFVVFMEWAVLLILDGFLWQAVITFLLALLAALVLGKLAKDEQHS